MDKSNFSCTTKRYEYSHLGFKGGELIAQQVGALSKTQLTEFIESNL